MQRGGPRDRPPVGKVKRTGNMIMKRRENPEGGPARKMKGMPMKVSCLELHFVYDLCD